MLWWDVFHAMACSWSCIEVVNSFRCATSGQDNCKRHENSVSAWLRLKMKDMGIWLSWVLHYLQPAFDILDLSLTQHAHNFYDLHQLDLDGLRFIWKNLTYLRYINVLSVFGIDHWCSLSLLIRNSGLICLLMFSSFIYMEAKSDLYIDGCIFFINKEFGLDCSGVTLGFIYLLTIYIMWLHTAGAKP